MLTKARAWEIGKYSRSPSDRPIIAARLVSLAASAMARNWLLSETLKWPMARPAFRYSCTTSRKDLINSLYNTNIYGLLCRRRHSHRAFYQAKRRARALQHQRHG